MRLIGLGATFLVLACSSAENLGNSGPSSSAGMANAGSGGSTGGASNAGGSTAAAGGSVGGGTAGAAGTSTPGGNSAIGGSSSAGTTSTSCGGASTGGMATGEPGVWEDVTPDGIDFTLDTHDNFGIQDVLVDPVRPSDLYAFVCRWGVWKSTDYGATFAKVSTGTNGDQIDSGKPWGAGIDTNPCRDPNTPPTLYTFAGAGAMGFWKSTDGGVNWTRSTGLPDQQNIEYDEDVYDVNVDPYDGGHLLVGYHEQPGLIESTDAGETWSIITPPDNGISVYPFFMDTGDAASTRKTWLTISQATSGGLNRTTDAGASWTKVEILEHGHGAAQIYQAGGGLVYVPGSYGTGGSGIYKSTDYGATWSFLANGSVYTMVGTPTHLYAGGPYEGSLIGASRDDESNFAQLEVPDAIKSGWKGGAVTYDGTHYILVTGNWTSGIWRYVEP